MRERRLVTDFGAYSTPTDFLIICISPPEVKLWEYLVHPPSLSLSRPDNPLLTGKMDQFYISYDFSSPLEHHPTPPSSPILSPRTLQTLQSQAEKVVLSPLIRSYISSILIALRLHPHVVSTSISSRAAADIRALTSVASLREGGGEGGWTNAGFVPRGVELCTRFRLRVDTGGTEGTFEEILRDVLENVRAPF
jgi:hypothetical protein